MTMALTAISRSESPASATSGGGPRAGAAFGPIVPLLAFLGLLLLAIGLLSSWVIKRMAEDYSRLIAQTALDLDRLHDISYHAGIGSATAIELIATQDPAKRDAMLRTIADERWANNAIFEELVSKAPDQKLRATLQEVLASRSVFTNRTDEFIQSTSSKPFAMATTNFMPVL